MSEDANIEIKKIGESFEAFKKVNDDLLAKQAKNEGGQAELKSQLEKIESGLSSALDMKKSIEELKASQKRLADNVEFAHSESEKKGIDLEVYGSALRKGLKAGWKMQNVSLSEAETKAMSAGSNPDGGYTLTPFLGDTSKIIFDSSPVRALATIQTIGTNLYQGYFDDDESGAGWVGELAPRSETTTAQIGQLNIPVNEMYAFPKISESLLEDSNWNLAAWLQGNVRDKFGRLEATAFVSGNTQLQPKGFTTYEAKTSNADVYTRNKVGTKVTAGANAITTDELVDVRTLLKSPYRAAAYWAFNRATEGYVRKLKDGDGNYIWQPSYQMGVPDVLLGQRTVIMEDMADIATGAVSVVLADFSSYLIVDRVGISVLEDRYTDKGKLGFYMRKRVGGALSDFDRIKQLKQA